MSECSLKSGIRDKVVFSSSKFTNVLPKINKTSDLHNYIFIKRKNNHTSVNHTCKETHKLNQKHKNKNNIRNASLQGGNTYHWFFTYITVLMFMALALFQQLRICLSLMTGLLLQSHHSN